MKFFLDLTSFLLDSLRVRICPKPHISALAFLSLFTSLLQAVETDPVGYVSNEVQAGGEAIISPSLTRPAVFTGNISAIDDADTITVSGSPGWTTNEYATNYYVLVADGNREGMWAVISANGADSLDLTFVTENLGATLGDRVEVGDAVKIIPFWTLATLLPDADVPDQSQVLLFDRAEAGINRSALATYTSFDGYGWYNGPTEGNNQIIYPDESLVFRTPAGSSYTFVNAGTVPMSSFRTVLSSVSPGVAQDIRMTSGLPISVTLQELFDDGASAEGDQILIFDNDEAGINKSALFTATYFDGYGWYDGPTERNAYALNPGQGFIYRKSSGNASDLAVSFKPSYQQ